MAILPFFAIAQNLEITGKVIGEDNQPIPGVTIVIKGSTTGTITDIDGNYKISAKLGDVLLFSFVGMENQEIAIASGNPINVTMKNSFVTLDELVVVGYGVQKKSLVTGAISQVSAADIQQASVTRVEQALQGKAAGVYVAQNSGEPGGGLSIKIRGTSSDGANDPIYLVDGVRTGGLESLNPSDIESIEILKDAASCAIYGAEGGNGVVLITTKKGKKGTGVVEYRYNYSIQQAVKLPKVMNGQEYKDYFMEAIHYMKNQKDTVLFNSLNGGKGTNWLDEIFEKAPMKEHQLSFSGGNENTTYYLSMGALDQDGIVGGPKNNLTRYSFRSNVESKVKDWITAGVNATYSHTKKKPLDAVGQYGGIVTTAMRYDPTIPVYYEDTSVMDAIYKTPEAYKALVKNENGQPYTLSTVTGGEMWNPVAKIAYTERSEVSDKILSDVHTDIHPVEWAKLTSRLYIDYSYRYSRTFNGTTLYGVSDKVAHDTLTNAIESWDRWYKYGLENWLTLDHQFGDHYVQVMGGMSYENYKHIWLSTKGYNIPYGDKYYGYASLGMDQERNEISSYVDNDDQDIELKVSYFGRFQYNFKEKYLVQGSLRRDGLSKFGPEKRFALFPSFSLGWNLHQESFFEPIMQLAPLNSCKLRYSWGKNGNAQNLAHFPYLTSLGVVDYPDGTYDGNLMPGKVPGTPGNSSLMWETSVQSNIGLDFGFLNNALMFSVDYFKKSTVDQLADKSDQPLSIGMTGTAKTNDGEIQNKGWEFILTYRGSLSDIKYNIGLNTSYLHNEVTKFGTEDGKPGTEIGQLGQVSYYKVGEPVWYFYGYQADGIFQNQEEINAYVNPENGQPVQRTAIPGDVKWKDLNGDYKITVADRTKLGKPLPSWFYGLNLGIEYKGFDVQAFFQGVSGNQIFWASYRNDNLKTNRASVWYEDRWTGEGTSNKFPRATYDDKNGNYRISSLNVYDGKYVRLKNLSIGYTIPETLTKKVGISKFKVFYTGTNLLTFTKYPGLDPEVGNSTGDNTLMGVDLNNYPATKVNSFGVIVNF
jgi:TonB-linked SusC/RagA family outer membrane protein